MVANMRGAVRLMDSLLARLGPAAEPPLPA
jgi:hypothetical protein